MRRDLNRASNASVILMCLSHDAGGYQLQRPASSLAPLETSRGIIEYTSLARKHKDNTVPPLPFPHILRIKTDDGLAVSN